MYILVINQTNGTTIKPLKAKSMAEAELEEKKILQAGEYTEGEYRSEIVCPHRNGNIDQTYRDTHPIHHCAQAAVWRDRQCAFVPACQRGGGDLC